MSTSGPNGPGTNQYGTKPARRRLVAVAPGGPSAAGAAAAAAPPLARHHPDAPPTIPFTGRAHDTPGDLASLRLHGRDMYGFDRNAIHSGTGSRFTPYSRFGRAYTCPHEFDEFGLIEWRDRDGTSSFEVRAIAAGTPVTLEADPSPGGAGGYVITCDALTGERVLAHVEAARPGVPEPRALRDGLRTAIATLAATGRVPSRAAS